MLSNALAPSYLMLTIKAGGGRKMGARRLGRLLETQVTSEHSRVFSNPPQLCLETSALSLEASVLLFLKPSLPWGPFCQLMFKVTR